MFITRWSVVSFTGDTGVSKGHFIQHLATFAVKHNIIRLSGLELPLAYECLIAFALANGKQEVQLSLRDRPYCLAICEALSLFGGEEEGRQWIGHGLDRALVDVYSLLIAIIPLIQFGRNVPCKFYTPVLEGQMAVDVEGRRRYGLIRH